MKCHPETREHIDRSTGRNRFVASRVRSALAVRLEEGAGAGCCVGTNTMEHGAGTLQVNIPSGVP